MNIRKEWQLIQQSVLDEQFNIDRNILIKMIFGLLKKMKSSIIQEDKVLYGKYLSYYENIDLSDYHFRFLWFDLKEFLQYQVLRKTPSNTGILIQRIRDIIRELIVYKSNRLCKRCGDDDLRVFAKPPTNTEPILVAFICDCCNYTEGLDERMMTPTKGYFPAKAEIIERFGIAPSKII
ncbi:MAG: hypothetical protein ACRBG0_25660 [Lewinella sp.]|uniref:hypothetical protein n=1 Tax=Lewinella sp. TaxID=2004506 RepID=UPI003D6B01C6